MFFQTVTLALFASSAVFAATIPTQVKERALVPDVEICMNIDFNDCTTVNFHFGECQEVGGRMNDNISSLRPHGHLCTFYNDTGCRNGNGEIRTTLDVNNVRSHPNFSTMNDDVSSFRCDLIA